METGAHDQCESELFCERDFDQKGADFFVFFQAQDFFIRLDITAALSPLPAAKTEKKTLTMQRFNWLIRQLSQSNDPDVFVLAFWPGRAQKTGCSLEAVRNDIDCLIGDNGSLSPTSFEVMLVRSPGGQFSKSQKFINVLEETVPTFYKEIGQHLKAWQPRAPKIEKETAEKVARANLQDEYDALNNSPNSSS